MAHTPGPWKAVPCHDNTWNVMHDVGLFYWTLHESEANARLIAAAPDLLEACNKLRVFVEHTMDFGERPCPICGHHYTHEEDCPYLIARDAIAKAEGEFEEAT